MRSQECSICYEKLGRIYRELSCGHRFHFKCLNLYETYKNNKLLTCPYCRESYRNIVLRERLSKREIEKKRNYVHIIYQQFNKIYNMESLNKNDIVKEMNHLFKLILLKDNLDLILNRKYGFLKFEQAIYSKISELNNDINKYFSLDEINYETYKEFNSIKKNLDKSLPGFISI